MSTSSWEPAPTLTDGVAGRLGLDPDLEEHGGVFHRVTDRAAARAALRAEEDLTVVDPWSARVTALANLVAVAAILGWAVGSVRAGSLHTPGWVVAVYLVRSLVPLPVRCVAAVTLRDEPTRGRRLLGVFVPGAARVPELRQPPRFPVGAEAFALLATADRTHGIRRDWLLERSGLEDAADPWVTWLLEVDWLRRDFTSLLWPSRRLLRLTWAGEETLERTREDLRRVAGLA